MGMREMKLFEKTKLNTYLGIIMLVCIAVMTVSIIRISDVTSLSTLPIPSVINMVMDDMALVTILLVMFSILQGQNLNKTKMIFTLLLFLCAIYMTADSFAWYVDEKVELIPLNIISNEIFYLCPYPMMLCFWRFLCEWDGTAIEKHKVEEFLLMFFAVIGVGLVLGNLFGWYYFSVSESGLYKRSEYYNISLICPVLMIILVTYSILRSGQKLRNKLLFLSYPWLPYLGATITRKANTATIMSTMTFFAVILLYLNLLVYMEKEIHEYRMKIAEKEVELAKKEAEIANGKARVIMSQIKPHFLYNALTAIMMIDGNPRETQTALKNFSRYLRGNIRSIDHDDLIPFSKELEHVRQYLSLEMLRFDDINVKYDIQESDFWIPPLCLQMLVENAVLHGVSENPHGGTICIESYLENSNIVVRVIDDGPGFDVKKAEEKTSGEREHVGLKNVQLRLGMIGGSLHVESQIGQGTTIMMQLPI